MARCRSRTTLLVALEQHAAALGYTRVVLDTNAELIEAIAMYESAGYSPTEQYNDNPYAQRWFTKSWTPGRTGPGVAAHSQRAGKRSVTVRREPRSHAFPTVSIVMLRSVIGLMLDVR